MRESIAIIGMACKMPGGANTPDEFWDKVLASKTDTVCNIPKARKDWDMEKYYAPNTFPGKYYVKTGAYLEEEVIRGFDSEFFMMSAREANSLDPQHRMLLQVSWEALENAGIVPSTLAGSNTGVYIGIHWDDYSAERYYIPHVRNINAYSTLSNLRSLSAGRISYFFDLQGPSLQIDTACSSALVSVVSAVKALQNNDIELALVGGVSLLLTPHMTIGFSQMGVLSKDGRCKTFSARADGFAQGEGCNVVILKRLSDAERDRDNIMAIIKGVAVNHDGRSLTVTTPSSIAQQKMLHAAIKDAYLEPKDIQYIETHGTGTSLGDYIEVSSLSNVFSRNRNTPLYLGSVKTNIGHLGATAGLASLTKVVLSIKNNAIPANLHFDKPNPRLKLDQNSFLVPTELTSWDEQGQKLAGISAFGMSGTNAHVIVSDYNSNVINDENINIDNYLFTISAKNQSALMGLVKSYQNFLTEDSNLAKICYTSNVGREHFSYRIGIKTNSVRELKEVLSGYLEKNPNISVVSGEINKEITFLFTGQGSQYANMGYELYNTYSVFRNAMDECALILAGYPKYMDKNLLELLYGTEYADGKILKETRYTQPTLFAFEYSLAQLWLSWGIKPSVVMGHSVGEYVAACIAGVFSLSDALKLISARGYFIEKLASEKQGGMLSILADAMFVQEHIATKYKDELSIAAVNSLDSVVVSGNYNAIIKLQHEMDLLNKKTSLLSVSHAFHSHLMQPVYETFLDLANTVKYYEPQIQILSNVTTKLLKSFDGKYWADHIIKPVLFAESIKTIDAMGIYNFIEIGPKPILIALADNCGLQIKEERMFIPSIRPMQELDTLITGLSKCYVRGINVNWHGFYNNKKYTKVILPNYCFDNKDTWTDVVKDNYSELYSIHLKHSLLQTQKLSPSLKDGQFQFESIISCEELDYIKDHQVFDKVICPASAYIEMSLFGAQLASSTEDKKESKKFILHDISIEKALEINDTKVVQLLLSKNDENMSYEVEIYSLNENSEVPSWSRHVTGKVEVSDELYALAKVDIERIKQSLVEQENIKQFYTDLKSKGINYGSSLQNIKNLWSNNKGQSLGYIEIKEGKHGYISHPGVLDSCFHLLLAAYSNNDLYLPVGYREFLFYRPLPDKVYSYISYEEQQDNVELLMATVKLFDIEGNVLAILNGCKLKKSINRSTVSLIDKECLYHLKWHKEEDNSHKNKENLGNCLIISDSIGIADILKNDLDKYAHNVFSIDRDNIEVLYNKLQEISYHNVIYLYNITEKHKEQNTCEVLLSLSQYIKSNNLNTRLLVVTKGVKELENTEKSLLQSVLWGFSNTLSLELDIQVTCVDLPLNSNPFEDSKNIISELLSNDKETQVSYKNGERYVARLQTFDTSNLDTNDSKILSLSTYGVLKTLHMKSLSVPLLKENEVKVKVMSSGINFRDLLRMLGMMRAIEDPLNIQLAENLLFGYECAGIVTEVGKYVKNFREGDEVIVYKPGGSIATNVIVPEELLVLKPSNLSFSEAATVPVAYITAAYGLLKCANLKPNDKILIHNAAGGVGQAAVQIAQLIGAEIYATAHPNKWDFLKSNGIKHVYSSRDINFKNQIKLDTNGDGIDVILNSLNGEFVNSSVDVLKKGGRFCEIGKLQVWDKAKFNRERPDAEFYMYDLSEIDNKGISLLLHEIVDMFRKGDITSLPVKEFTIDDVEQAMRYMQQAKHIGKVALTFNSKNKIEIAKKDATYIITGGLGGLGLRIMSWLVNCGARHIILASRSKPNSQAQELIDVLLSQHVKVEIVQADISKYEEAKQLIDRSINLKGIIHAAGIIEDGLISNQSAESFSRVMAAKVSGTWNLHTLTSNFYLDYFICFSSVASILGSVGQSNYSAANSFMDHFAHYRRSIGLPCISINWGPWAEAGMAANLIDRLKTQGYKPLSIDSGLEILEKIISSNVVSQIAVLPMNWHKYLERINKHIPFFDKIMDITDSKEEKALLIDILESTDTHEKLNVVEKHIKDYVRTVIGLSTSTNININTSIFDFGLDSLMAVELKNIIEKNVKTKLRSTLLFDYPTVKVLVNYIAQEILSISTDDIEEIVQGDRISSDIGAREDEITDLEELKDLIEEL